MVPVRTTMPVRAVVNEQTARPFGLKGPLPHPTGVAYPRTAQVAFPAPLNSRG